MKKIIKQVWVWYGGRGAKCQVALLGRLAIDNSVNLHCLLCPETALPSWASIYSYEKRTQG